MSTFALDFAKRAIADGRSAESWDNDEDLVLDDADGIGALNLSAALKGVNHSRRSSNNRSISGLSKLTFSNENVKNEVTQAYNLSTDDLDQAVKNVINAGIPIPRDTPSSALLGGTINRLGSVKGGRTANMDDWQNDIDIPDAAPLKLALKSRSTQSNRPPSPSLDSNSKRLSSSLDRFKPERTSEMDDFEEDFDIPAEVNLVELKSPIRRKESSTPLSTSVEEDDDWAETSLGNRRVGGRRGYNSDRMSSATLSPTNTIITVESDNDNPIEGIEFGNIYGTNLQDLLDRRMRERAVQFSPTKPRIGRHFSNEDLLQGLEIEGENPFDVSKLHGHRNIIQKKPQQPSSPQRKVAISVRFGLNGKEKNPPPKFNATSERPTEPHVPPRRSSVGKPKQSENFRPSSAQNRPSSQQTSSRPSSQTTRYLSNRLSDTFIADKTSSNKIFGSGFSHIPKSHSESNQSRMLNSKKSMPVLRSKSPQKKRGEDFVPTPKLPPLDSVGVQGIYNRTNKFSGDAQRLPTESPSRPRSPNQTRDSSTQPNRPAFIPGGASVTSSHHISAMKNPLRQTTSTNSIRSISSGKRLFAPESLRKEALRTKVLTTPRRIRDFGDGSELDAFDDLPVNQMQERKFTSVAKGVGTPNGIKRFNLPTVNKSSGNETRRDGTIKDIDWRSTPRPQARTSSQVALQLAKPSRKLAPNPNKHNTMRAGRHKPPGKGPTLIKPLNTSHDPRSEGSMRYNPSRMRWDGNEEQLKDFDSRDVTSPPRPALISQSGSVRGVQVVGGMIFDPQRMCWLTNATGEDSDGFDEEDPFAGLEDLSDDYSLNFGAGSGAVSTGHIDEDTVLIGLSGNTRTSGIEEGSKAEEFELDPEWVARQKEWESRWRIIMKGWKGGIEKSEERRRIELYDIWHVANNALVPSKRS